MSDPSARHGPSHAAPLNSLNPGTHQPQTTGSVSTTGPPPAASAQAAVLDPTTILLLALFGAIVATAFWRVLLKIAIVAGLALVFAGILVPAMMLSNR